MARMNGKSASRKRHLAAVPDGIDAAADPGTDTPAEPAAGSPAKKTRRAESPALLEGADDPTAAIQLPTSAADELWLGRSLPDGLTTAGILQELTASGAPPDVLAELAASLGDEQLFIQRMGELASQSRFDHVSGILSEWTPLLKKSATPLAAEIAGCELIASFDTFAAELDAPENPLIGFLEATAETKSREALVMVRILSRLGSQEIRDAARQAAERLAMAGVKDMPWVGRVGQVDFEAAFGFLDTDRMQRSTMVEFSYGQRRHILAVFIDYRLGGGLKDCWVTEDVSRLRAQVQLAIGAPGMDYESLSAEQAAAILHTALAARPCPEGDEAIEDVNVYGHLVKARWEALPGPPYSDAVVQSVTFAMPSRAARRAGPKPTTAGRSKTATAPPRKPTSKNQIHRIKVTLAHVKPPIWRRLEVPSTTTLTKLHQVIQDAMPWSGGHLWMFETAAGEYGPPDAELGTKDAARVTLATVAPSVGAKIKYSYDFGDGWEHAITVEAIEPAAPGVSYPRCTAGRRASPPEDCGGPWGYQELIETLQHPEHPEHPERLDWLGLDSADEFRPEQFDVAETSAALRGASARLT